MCHPAFRALFVLAVGAMPLGRAGAMNPNLSLQTFDAKARRGEAVTVVFLGGSLTWGANASDPQTTSYRGRMMEWLRRKYPHAPIEFRDASIGGTGSQLAMFRLDRDVLSHHPDLVFLDFTVNDGAENKDMQSLASYERIVRELLEHDVMVMPVLMMFRQHAESGAAALPPRHQAHSLLADAYHLPCANTIPYVVGKIRQGADVGTLWPFEKTHPDDPGYALLFEAVRDRYEKALAENIPAAVPARLVFDDLYPRRNRLILVETELPEGWRREKTYRTALWFDGQSSRWMGDVACASHARNSGPLEVGFEGSMVGLFGERNGLAPAMRISIDGQPVAPPGARPGNFLWPMDTSRFAPPKNGSGNLFGWTVLSNDLPDGKHTLRIEPVWEGTDTAAELRIESVCSAGR